ncbi:dynein light chain Tctex-type protein 2B isoform X2 [Brienomyrus brachyistius]|uniref:dynein light chain Tctex-type protein 2B isoform X2 n=1 Tax=Brienomyrus brachyistius TaxID=42636 RepID=UPI0020B3466E|nr:dynein light chain Tctex-type protein 2B isoform X2 [Brienomyrus brachyistius]
MVTVQVYHGRFRVILLTGRLFLIYFRMEETCAAENTYIIRPNYQHKFKGGLVKECIRQVLKEELAGQRYAEGSEPQLCASVADCIRKRLQDMGFDRYKFVVQVAIGEQRGQGIKYNKVSLLRV